MSIKIRIIETDEGFPLTEGHCSCGETITLMWSREHGHGKTTSMECPACGARARFLVERRGDEWVSRELESVLFNLIEPLDDIGPFFICERCGLVRPNEKETIGTYTTPDQHHYKLSCKECGLKAEVDVMRDNEGSPWSITKQE